MPVYVVAFVFGVAAVLALLVSFRSQLMDARGGKILAFVALLFSPLIAVWVGFSEQMERAKLTEFCLSCHVMETFGRTLYMDDPSYIPAQHFQNSRVDREHACYTCHTNYTMFGTVKDKWRGLGHLYVQYFGSVPAPEKIKLYEPYNNRECLHCHLNARGFEGAAAHLKTATMLQQTKMGKLSCLNANCHDIAHGVEDLTDAKFWKGGK